MRRLLSLAVIGALVLCACSGADSSDTPNDSGTPADPNQPGNCKVQPPPVARAGPDQTVSVGALVFLDGSASTGAGGPIRRFSWFMTEWPPSSFGMLQHEETATPILNPDGDGQYVITLIVFDACNRQASDSVTVTVTNQAPIAHAGSSRTVPIRKPVMLDGRASTDPDGHTLTFSWEFASAPAGNSAYIDVPYREQASFTPNVAGAYVVRLRVTDSHGKSASVTVTLTAENLAPSVDLGPSRIVPSRKPVTLDASAATDPNGDPITFAWSLDAVPAGSQATLSGANTAKPTFTPDQEGTYVVQLVARDAENAATSVSLTLTAENRTPTAYAGPDFVGTVGNSVPLRGKGTDENGDPLTFAWTLTQKPAGSTASLSGADTPTPTLGPDVEGAYTLSLVVDDGRVVSAADTVILTARQATPTSVHPLAHTVRDAEYSQGLDRLVMVATEPNALYIYDPLTRTETAVPLPLAPSSVSVGPDGRFAAVGHDANISYVDLSTAKLLKVIPVSTNVLDIVLAGNGYAYAFPVLDQWETIRCINLATGQETQSGMSIYAGTKARLHPGGTAMYGADRGLSPDDIEKYSIAHGTAQVLYDSPYHGTYSMCGELWFSEEGSRIFTACGNTFRSSEVQSEDMVYAGALSGASPIRSLTHSSAANRIALVRQVYGTDQSAATQVRLYMPDFLNYDTSLTLPSWMHNNQAYASYGRYVFYSGSGDKLTVVVQADSKSGLQKNYGVVTFFTF